MRNKLTSLAWAALAWIALPQESLAGKDDIVLSTPNTSIVLSAPQGEALRTVYYGARIQPEEVDALYNTGLALRAETYPAFGQRGGEEDAICVVHADGDQTLDLVVESTQETTDEKGRKTLCIALKDKVYPFYVKVFYKAYPGSDMLETWTEISHKEKKNVVLRRFGSGALPIRRGDVWITHQHGSWGAEAGLTIEPLTPGMKVVKNRDGVRNGADDRAEIMFSLDGKPEENTGRVIGAALCWSGNYKLRIDTDNNRLHRFIAGINEDASEYHLEPKEVFTTPELALTYSEEGQSGVSRNFHKWALQGKLHGGDKPRDILLNSWEGVYCYIKEPEMYQMMRDIAGLGGELFVMDDGWFGHGKYLRNNDTDALGDWETDTLKLPHGIQALVDTAAAQGIKFGIWIEPEMTNTRSYLYEEHPDWIVCSPKREPIPGRGRTQLVLDASNPKVQDFIVGVVDNLMEKYPGIAYIKWDANMNMQQYGSHYLTGDKKSHLSIDYHRGLQAAWKRIRAKYPDLIIQACGSGGARANYGVMPYFDEFWVSDNTDALQRVYIQWGTSLFFPAQAMASHVSASPNHQTGRNIPLKYRFDVAMSGRLGMEMQPKTFTPEEREYAKKTIEEYKNIRPIVQQGEIYRLVSPYDRKGVASLMFCTPEKDKAVFFAYKTEHFVNQTLPRIRPAGLDPKRNYRITELSRKGRPLQMEGKSISGALLMSQGFDLPLDGEYASRVLLLTAE